MRIRRVRGVERQQLKWFVFVASLLPLTIGLGALGLVPAQRLVIVPIAALPFATGFAILRQGLYDIDLIIRRTLIYGAVSAVLLAAYIGGVALSQFVLAPFTAGSGVAVAISTLAVVALFQPLRRRIQEAVDRRFYRSRHDAARTLDAFADELRDEVDLDDLRADLIDAVGATMAPAHASLWLRERQA